MKLMPPANVSDKRAQEQARDVLRTEELNKASDKARKQLADSEADFKGTLARQRLQWAQGEEEHAKRTQEMDAEITALEKRKEQALIPISLYEKQADEKMSEALECLQTAKVKETENEETRLLLEDKLDEVGQREQDVTKQENQLRVRLAGILQQDELSRQNSKAISEAYVQLSQVKAQAEKEIAQKVEDNTLKERTLLAKEESLKRTEKELETIRIKLKDERETLERAFARLSPLQKEK